MQVNCMMLKCHVGLPAQIVLTIDLPKVALAQLRLKITSDWVVWVRYTMFASMPHGTALVFKLNQCKQSISHFQTLLVVVLASSLAVIV